MNDEKRLKAQERLNESSAYRTMEQMQKLLDQYYLDGIIGLLPFGIGDVLSALFASVYVWFAFTKVRSVPLVLAILNNSLRDVMLGLIPFYVGNVIDFFHRANRQNMTLVRGFVDGDRDVIREVNRKALQSALLIGFFLLAIIGLIVLLVWLTRWILS
ncbi:MAG: DUF4112 domain-containing protein [Prevotella sp.]|nr:DUF4112 domain-containing protein [Prevotella sp.]